MHSHTAHAAQPAALTPNYYPLVWLLCVSFAGFALYVAWNTGLLALVYRLDQSYIALIITALALMASLHAAWHVVSYSTRIAALLAWLGTSGTEAAAHIDRDEFLALLLSDLADAHGSSPLIEPSAATESIIEIHADRLRSPVELGWFLVDLAVRLGLVGTIVGFILIFTSLSDSSVSGAEGIRDLLVSMSSGMGTALFTTLTGLIAASLLSVQYLILGRQTETLVGLMVRVHLRQGRAGVQAPDLPAGSPEQPVAAL